MGKRPPLALGLLPFLVLGILLGLGDFARLAHGPQGPVERLTELRRIPPTPRSVFWVEGIRGPSTSLADSERLLIGLSLVALLGVFLTLGATLSPRFQLLKAPEKNPGSGLSSHVEVGGALLTAGATVLSLWLVGALQPVALLISGGKPGLLTQVLGGIPTWTGSTSLAGVLVLSLVLLPALWMIWGPRGPLFPAEGVSTRDVLLTGILAGGAALPAVLALYTARGWLVSAGTAYSLADAPGWRWLLILSGVIPVLALVYLALVVRVFRPQALRTELITGLGLFSLVATGLATFGYSQGRQALYRLDVGVSSLATRLGLPAPQLQRYAGLLGPGSVVLPAVTEDGVSESQDDRIESTGKSRDAVERYLRAHNFRTTLAFRAFGYLDGCCSLDWESSRSLALRLEALERAPSPLGAQLMIQRLVDCPTSAANRAVLDRLADPKVFAWTERDGSRRLGAAYARFGDADLGRKYLLAGNLNAEEAQQALGGVSPLADGVVRGKLTVDGKPLAGIRIGLVRQETWPRMAGLQRPYNWSAVLEAALTDAQGGFELRDIPQGQYVLAVTGAKIGTSRRWSVNPSPGLVLIDRFHPLVTIPKMDIQQTGPTLVPRDTDLGTAA